jgi:etoposide-induced 2.4 mRNA
MIRHPSPFVPIRLHIFAPVVFLNDLIAKFLDMIIPPTRPRHVSRNSALGDPSVGIEEGSGIELNRLKPAHTGPMKSIQNRVNIGPRRKLD